MVLQNLDFMQTDKIQITLSLLKDGSRLLRLSEPETSLALGRALNRNCSVSQQKQQLKALLQSRLPHTPSPRHVQFQLDPHRSKAIS
jgi:hypothetical protein